MSVNGFQPEYEGKQAVGAERLFSEEGERYQPDRGYHCHHCSSCFRHHHHHCHHEGKRDSLDQCCHHWSRSESFTNYHEFAKYVMNAVPKKLFSGTDNCFWCGQKQQKTERNVQ